MEDVSGVGPGAGGAAGGAAVAAREAEPSAGFVGGGVGVEKEEIFARAPTSEEVKQLQLPPGEPVVELHRTTFTASGTVVEFAIGVHAASRFAWEYDFKVPDSAADQKGQ